MIITAGSAGWMVDIHGRRQVVPAPELAREWFDPATPRECAEQMVSLQGEPTETYEWYRVDTAVGNARNNRPELLKSIT